MEKNTIIRTIDHTLLKQDATWEQIRNLCIEGMENEVASVCIPPSFVKQAAEFVEGKLPICTVIGFPNGYQTMAIKAMEAAQAVKNGADEIDMVINIGWAKEKRYDDILKEINDLKEYKPSVSNHGHLPQKGDKPPFIMKGPGIRKDVVVPSGRLIDEAPTILKTLGLSMPTADGTCLDALFE